MCFIRFKEDILPLVARRMVDLLSWYKILWVTSYPCALMKYNSHMMDGMSSSMPISSLLIELRALSFYFLEMLIVAPLLKGIILPVWPLLSQWVLDDASTHHLLVFMLLTIRVNFRCFVSTRYLMTRFNFPQLCSSGAFARVVKKDTSVFKSSLDGIHRNISCATVWWKS